VVIKKLPAERLSGESESYDHVLLTLVVVNIVIATILLLLFLLFLLLHIHLRLRLRLHLHLHWIPSPIIRLCGSWTLARESTGLSGEHRGKGFTKQNVPAYVCVYVHILARSTTQSELHRQRPPPHVPTLSRYPRAHLIQ
jgi:hypothetical protein